MAQDVVQHAVSAGLGDNREQSWQQIAEDAFGNALGNAAIAGIEEANAHNATKPAQAPIEIDPGKPQIVVQDLNMPLAPIGPVSYTVQSGDSLSGILGTSDPAAIGAIMQANGLNSSTIYPGEQLVFPSGGYTEGDASLGQATLNMDNQRIEALQATVTIGPGEILSQGTGTDNQTGNNYGNLQMWASQAGFASPTLAGVSSGTYQRSAQAWYSAAINAYDNQFPPGSLVTEFVLPNGPQLFATDSPEGAVDILRSQLGLPQDAKISTDSIMNVEPTGGAYTEAADGSELNVQALEDEARYEFGGKLAFSIEVRSPVLTTFAMVNGTNAVNANIAMMNGTNSDAQEYAYDHAPDSQAIPENEQPKAVVDGIGVAENIGTEVSEVPASRLEYRYDVFVSPSDPSNFRVEITQYNFDYADGGGMLYHPLYSHQAYALLNGSGK